MSDNNEVGIKIETENETPQKPDFLIDVSDEDVSTEIEVETDQRTIEDVEAEIEALKTDFKKHLEAVAENERAQYEEERERLLRTAAEAENTKRRIETEAQKQFKFANRNIMEGLIPVLDSLEAAMKSVDEKVVSDGNTSDITNFSEGVELVHKQLLDVLKMHGLTPIEASSGAFDPNQHEAIFATESEDVPEGDVIEALRRGYLLHEQVIRAAQVIVSKGSKVEESSPENIKELEVEKTSDEKEIINDAE